MHDGMHDAIVLAGGSARRLGGVDKPALLVEGVSLLDRVLLACASAATTVVVGPVRPTCRPVRWTREQPAGAGPVPALVAGLGKVTADVVLLLAADLPLLTDELTTLLAANAPAFVLDESRPQWLCSAWRTAELREAARGAASARLDDLLRPLGGRALTWSGKGRPWEDCDDWADLERVRKALAG